MKARIVASLAALALVLVLPASPVWAAEPIALENEFVRVVVNPGPDEAGRFSIRTTGGDPSRPASKNQHLIFGANAPWTSYTTLLLDGEKYVFGGPTQRRAGQTGLYGNPVAGPTLRDGAITTTYRLGDVEVTQALSLVRGTSTRMLDTVGIAYRLTNTGGAARKVGLRVMLDTMCGSNDGAPIYAGSDAITKAMAIGGQAVPEYWQAFDSLTSKNVISQCTLRAERTPLTAPDRVLFADWGTLADEPWEPKLEADQGFIRKGEADPDTATAMFWGPVSLEPDQSTTFVTYYGIGYMDVKPGNLSVGMVAPAETTYEHERTQTFTVTGRLLNAGGFDARNVTFTLALPPGLSLVEGEVKHSYPLLKSGEMVSGVWRVRANGKKGGKQPIVLTAASANVETNQNEHPLQVHVPPSTVTIVPSAQTLPTEMNGLPTLIPLQINLLPADDFVGVRLTLTYDPAILAPLGAPFGVSRGRAFVEGGRLLTWNYDDAKDGVITITGKRVKAAPLTQAEINLATIKFRVLAAGTSALKVTQAVAIDAQGAETPLAVADGAITIVAPAP